MKILVIFLLSIPGMAFGACTTGASGQCEVGSGKTYATPALCSAAAVAGQTCRIYAGSYAGWTQAASGSAGNLITFIADTTASITSGVTISGRSYIRISGLAFTQTITANSTTTHNQLDHNTSSTTFINIPSNAGGGGSDNTISYNIVDLSSHADSTPGFNVYGDRNLFDHNEIKNGEGDCFDLGGANVVVRNNYCHDINGASGEHIDFVQVIGGVPPTLSFTLIENNVERHCYNDGGNCHFLQVRASGGQIADTLIARYNYTYNNPGDHEGNLTGIGYYADGSATTPNGTSYNNTGATNALTTSNNGGCIIFGSGVGNSANNICYNVIGDSSSPTYYEQGGTGNANMAFTTGHVGGWNAPYSNEPTYAALLNKDPLFANYPTDGTLQAGSPAIGAGVALTTASGSGAGSTALTVANSHFFQPGWAGVQADWIRIGASTTVQIASINYGTNVITLATPVSWVNADKVYLYKDSSGRVVLAAANPDLGAFPSIAGGQPLAPTNLTVIVH